MVQLTFLQLLSATAKQTFTYNCLNSAAWLHSAPHSYKLALRFQGANGEELTHESTQYISALYDGCQVGGARLQSSSSVCRSLCWCVFLCRSHAQGRRGRCWSLTPRCPTRSPYWMWPCLILATGTRSLVSRLARFATMVNRAGIYFNWSNLMEKRSHGHFLHAGKNNNKTKYLKVDFKTVYFKGHGFSCLSVWYILFKSPMN